MMHLRNFCQVSIEEVRQVMTRSPVKVPLSTETVKGVGPMLKIGDNWSYASPVKNFWLRHCRRLTPRAAKFCRDNSHLAEEEPGIRTDLEGFKNLRGCNTGLLFQSNLLVVVIGWLSFAIGIGI